MSQELTSVGTLKTQSVGVTVERMGQTLTLAPDAPVFWNDKIVNGSSQTVQIQMPALHPSHGNTVLELAPGASARRSPKDAPSRPR